MHWYMGTKILNQPTLLEAILKCDRSKAANLLEEPKKSSSFEVLVIMIFMNMAGNTATQSRTVGQEQ